MTTFQTAMEGSAPTAGARAWRWLRDRLFSSPANTLLSLTLLGVIGWLTWSLGSWLFLTADFDVIRTNRRLLLIGRFPHGEEWRLWPIFFGLIIAIGWTWGAWTRATRVAAATLGLFGLLVLPIIAGAGGTLDAAPAFAAGVVAYLAAHRWAQTRRGQRRAQVVAAAMWLVLLPSVLVLLRIGGGVDPTLWGGLYLNVIVASTAAAGALPFGIVLALARTSSFRVLRISATVYVELMRGLPLPVMLTLAWLALRHFLPAWGGLDSVALVYRVTIAFALFTAAFIAEAIRGGLSGIPRGQREAASALGLTWVQVTTLITMPQAIRNSLPALAGEFIGLFMMTTMVAVVGLTDMLQAARATTEQPDFFGRQKEVLLFVGLLFWVTAFGLSRLSSRLERGLMGSGTRRA